MTQMPGTAKLTMTMETNHPAPVVRASRVFRRHPATLPLTLHEREIAARLLACGWGIGQTARALQRHRELIHCCHAA